MFANVEALVEDESVGWSRDGGNSRGTGQAVAVGTLMNSDGSTHLLQIQPSPSNSPIPFKFTHLLQIHPSPTNSDTSTIGEA